MAFAATRGNGWPAALAAWYIHSANRESWTKALREAQQELDAATTRSPLSAAAKKLQRARGELKRLEAEGPKRRAEPWFALGGRFLRTCSASSISNPDDRR